MNRKTAAATGHGDPGKRRPRGIVAPDPRTVPIPADEQGEDIDRPFEEGAHDVVDPDLRHRMISEAAYALYVGRNYADGYDLDDWLAAEDAVDHILLER